MLGRYFDLSLFGTKQRRHGLKCLYERSGFLVDPQGDYSRLFQIFRLMIGVAWQASIFFAEYREVQRDGWGRMMEHSGFICMVMGFSVVSWVSLYTNQGKIWRLLDARQEISRRCRLLDWEKEEAAKEEDNAWFYNDIMWNLSLFYINVIYTIVPCYLDYLVFLVYPAAPSLRVDLPLQVFLDALGDRNWANFAFTNAIILCDAFTVIAHIGLESSFIFAIMDARNEIKFVQRKLALLKERIGSTLDGGRADAADGERLVRNIILHHQLIEEYLERIRDTYGFSMAAQRSTFSFCCCFCTYSITTANKPPSQLFQDACCICFLGLILFALCRLGESLATEMEALRLGAYDLPWWDRGVKSSFKTGTQMMLRQAARPPYINYKKLYVLNLEAFQDTVNQTYSLYMMLKTVNE